MRIIFNFFCFLLSITYVSNAQNNYDVIKNVNIFGQNLAENTVLLGTEYIFSDFIYDVHLDRDASLMTLELRQVNKDLTQYKLKGSIVQFDLNKKTIIWSKKTHYGLESFKLINNVAILMNNATYGSSYIDSELGILKWKKLNMFNHFNIKKNIGIGFNVGLISPFNSYLEGVNLSTGQTVWKRKLSAIQGWENSFYENDSTLIVISSGLQKIDLKTGQGWEYTTKNLTSNFNKLNALPQNIISSNVVHDSLNFFYASKIELAKINKENGTVVWKQILPENETSDSKLVLLDKNILLLNLGLRKGRVSEIGKPFIAQFNIETGEKIFNQSFKDENSAILDYKILDNKIIFLLFKNKVSKIDLNTGLVLDELEFKKEEVGNLVCFVDHAIAMPTADKKIKTLENQDSFKYYIFSTKNYTIPISHELEPSDVLVIDQIFAFNNLSSDFKFVKSIHGSYLINNEGTLIAELKNIEKPQIIDHILYAFKENKLVIIDLDEFLIKK